MLVQKSFLLACAIISLYASQCVPIDALYSDTYKLCAQKAYATTDHIACLENEIKYQDKKLNKAYKQLHSRIQAFRRDDLIKLQRAWIAYRDAKCGFYIHKQSGTGAILDALSCKLDMTIKRTIELQESN